MFKDTFGRVHDYLRISLTDNCNLRCTYCMPDEDYDFTPASKLMQLDEITAIAKTFVDQGVTKIRLTGGEPLVRKDAAQIIQNLAALPVKLAITTNATRLHHFLDLFERVNLRAVNISLDTLQPAVFKKLTQRDQFDEVKRNIDDAIARGFDVKINMVVMQGINESEIPDFVAWTKKAPIQIRFIEFMPFSGNHWNNEKTYTLDQMLNNIQAHYTIEALHNHVHDTTKRYRASGHVGEFAVISTMSSPFCAGCNRMRLTADGKFKNCLFSSKETDLLSAYRNKEHILPLIQQAIHEKAAKLGGQFTENLLTVDSSKIENRSMITIGG
ncbi:GTP 3',8-cyclase MoaA [Sphingobacterium oryzagri]|uniref:GTP 3',8-cyclase n=1 Tax=Sphingobacterium oryzagri TaxID=3025669 RepID=A0ABY7WB04_9SPHI|nr:GTP 3',8-cyclase MoaA [Sphingobacterium sp. KACC 22765]WDF66829.1 GTP 3',8-cyclase MoaA [Sphingobacterium sp. KACC 22765]